MKLKKILFITLFLIGLTSNAQTVSLFAGSGYGYLDGSALYAKFSSPSGMVMDSSGNMYICDSNNNRIRKITPAGVVSTFAGSTFGFLDGIGTAAQFNYPNGLTIDTEGNIYVVDKNNHKIRKITSAGVVTTVAGSSVGFTNGLGTSAQFNSPSGIAVDANGNLYITDTQNHKIRKIDTNGNVTTFAGSTQGAADGTGTSAQFYFPQGIAIDNSGNLYVTDYTHRVRKIYPTGVVVTIAGSSFTSQGYVDGPAATAKFDYPCGLALDSYGNIYVADYFNNKIRKIATDGMVSTFAGSSLGYQDGPVETAKFNFPYGLFLASNGLYVADTSNNCIRKIAGGTLSIQENLLEDKTNIYPNPVKDILNIQSDEEVKTVDVYNSLGQKVMNVNKNQVDVSSLSKGVYVLRVESKYGKITTQKFIKE